MTGPSRRGADLAIALLECLAEAGRPLRLSRVAASLNLSRASLYRAVAIFAGCGLLDRSRRGFVALGPVALKLAQARDEMLRLEDAARVMPRPKPLQRTPATVGNLACHPASVAAVACSVFRRAPKFRIGFANATIDSPWRTALVHSVEFGAVKYRDLVSALDVRHADQCAARQAADILGLLAAGAEGLIVSAVASDPLAEVLLEAERRGIPTVLVDRGQPERLPHVSFVTCNDDVIGATMALWLGEILEGRGRIVLLPGLAQAEPAQRRLIGARSVLGGFPGLAVLAVEWTDWSGVKGYRVTRDLLHRFGDAIDGVWCDSGLQAVGSLRAFLAAKGGRRAVPPHTGGDLNLAYKLAVRHGVPLAAVDYPPAMGLRAVEVLLDILRGRSVPRRIDVATEIVVTRHHSTPSVKPDLWADEHVRWDLPDDLILASGLGISYDPRSFRVRYPGNRYNQSAAARPPGASA